MLLFVMIPILGLIIVSWYGLPLLIKSIHTRAIRRICKREKLIALTYDDGPFPGMTEQVLEMLQELEVRATFFMIGNLVHENDRLLKRVADEGHHIATHTENHLDAWKVGPIRGVRDFLKGCRTLKDRELEVSWFRPPRGKATLGTLLSCWTRGCRMIWWTHDSGDTGFGSGKCDTGISEILKMGLSGGRRLLPEEDVRLPELREDLLCSLEVDGGVVLLHDGDRKYKSCKALTLECTREIVERAKRNGFRFVTLEELK